MASSSTRKNNNQSESAKTEQIITEFFSKSLHIILESRSPCVSSRNFSGEQTFSSPSSSSSSSTSVRPRDKWFNLALQECPAALENLDLWRQSNLEPMVVDVVLVKRPVDLDTVGYSPGRGTVGNLALQERFPSRWNSRDEDFMMETKSEKIIERWIVQYETRNKSKEVKNVNKRGGSNTSHSLYRKSIILLRSLYLTVRILPAYKLYRDLNSSAQIHTFSLAHRVSSFVEPFTQREEVDMHQFAFTPVETSCGRLCLTVLYRPTLSDVNLEPLAPISPQFIPDYVGSPTTHPLKRFPLLPRTGLESPSSGPFTRRHSWSYDTFRNSPPLLSSSPSPAYSDSRAFSSKLNSNQPQLLCSPHHPRENPYSFNSSHTHKNAGFDEYCPSPMLSPSPSPPTHYTDLSKALLRSGSAPVSIPTSKLGTSPASNLPTSHVPPLSPSPRRAEAKSASQADNTKSPMKLGDNPAGITTKKINTFGKEECCNSPGTKLSSHISPRISSTRSLGNACSGRTAYVHCKAGRGRSTTIVLCYLAHAASAVLNFSENCTPDILTPYLDGIVSKLLVLLQNGKQMVQEGALTALASVADSSQEHFQKYYDSVMPYLKAILMNATDKSNRMLRAKSMECISLVGMAVGKDKFRDDAKQVMEVLMTLQGSQMETDDPTTSYMLQAWARLCKCLGQDFLPYMSVVMPPLLQSAQLKPDVTITSADSDADIDVSDDESIETITLGDKRIGIKTSVLEEKATACNMLCCYADELKEGFYPWIDQVAPTLVPLLKFYFHEEVRKAAVSAMPELLRSAKLAIEKGQAPGRNESYIKQLSDYIIPALVEALHKEPETEICASMLDALNECVQVSGPLLDESQVRCIVDEIKNVITASSTRKRERAERAKAEDFDAEEGELLNEENEQEEEVFDQVGDCLGTLIKTFKASFLPFFDELSSYITPMWGKDKTAEERRIAICIFDDVSEQCREAALKYYDTYLPFLLEACNDENPDVRQAAVYGIGVCAEFGGSVFRPLVGEALSRINVVIRHPNALHADNLMAYDNAVSALGKICQFHRDGIDAAQVVPAWLSCLPIKGDLIEAKLVHDQLCSMVERSDGELLGPNNQYLPKIVAVFAEVLCVGKDLATEQTASRMINLLRQLQQTLPPSTLASTWSSLQPQQQLALQSILSS